jgi:trk system potassium uptake protein TrkA
MKRFVVIGLGNFGASVAEALYAEGHEVLAIDLNERAVDRIAPRVTRAVVCDARDLETLERLGVREVDVGIISTGDDITASVLSTLVLRDLGVGEIYVKVISRDHARVMNRLGVTETIFPERESALNLASRLSGRALLNYFRIGTGFGIQEMAVPDEWEGKSLRELQLRQHYGLSVVAVRDVLSDHIQIPPDPDVPLRDTDTLFVAGKEEDLERVARLK